ncbi:Ribonuclease H-like domain [Cinara cedri]|uniref:Ribonuclease H-like domain n=1 Tax=Cinara cedri TaxID=506608 RepID=A0A5E4MIE1_9HEMI|nr:Ribonuclease H-like domain [Cinara cedri]
MNINMYKYNPFRGASYIQLPKFISDKKVIINIKNEDNKCFLWSILAALHPAIKDANRVSKYKEWKNEFNERKKNRILDETINYCQSENLDLENVKNIEKETEYFKKRLDELIKEKQMFFEELEDNIKKVKDHDHLTGKYRGAAHSICNLNYKVPRFVPVFFHNLSGYGPHLFINELGIDKENIKTNAISDENYVSFSKNIQYIHIDPITKNPVLDQKGKPIFKTVEIRFLDSFKFLFSSLKKLANTLEPYQFKELSNHYPEQLDLVKGKLSSLEKYDEESLPNIDQFYSSLTGKHVTQNAYENAKKIWERFEIKKYERFYHTL